MSSTELEAFAAKTYNRRLREFASDLAYQVASGEITELEANEWLVTVQDRLVDAPWG